MSLLKLKREFYIRLGIVALGALVGAPGLYAWIHAYYWYTKVNHTLGRVVTGPTVGFAFLGLLIILFGVFSPGWDEVSPREQKELNRAWQRNHRHGK